CVLPTDAPGTKYYLVLGCLGRGPGPFRVRVRARPAAGPASLPVDESVPDTAWAERVAALRARLHQARRDEPPPPLYPPAAAPSPHRVFYLFTGDGDFQDAAGYAAVDADLCAVGRHCLVYLDRQEPDPARVQPTAADIVRTFDEEVYPRAEAELGHALDVDRDGRFAVLLSGRLGHLQNGRVSVGGFVRGTDFYADLPAPYGNRCDLMYLNTSLRPGPRLRTILAHEYTHAIVFSERLFGSYLADAPRQDEEAWLNEGLAHLVEERRGHGWSNLDYRIDAFLNTPERYQLVVPDYYRAGLWRTPGNRGAVFLFLRWCARGCGPDLVQRLVRTNLTGVTNLEVETGRRFADLFRAWSAALVLPGADAVPAVPGRVLCGPRFTEMILAGDERDVEMVGTSAAYLLLHSPAAACSRLTVEAEPGALVQATLIRLPEGSARLSLRQETGSTPGTVRLVVSAHDAPVVLHEAAVEPFVPPAGPDDGTAEGGTTAADPRALARAWFGGAPLQPGETRKSPDLPSLQCNGPSVVKVTGTDGAGRPVAAWLLGP
ncbi:MAG TPA: hypothetical protein VJ739_01535, partial [Gemmataceae bacterium]|nr:hypothetical protein [Gemmataceae bacterium]